SQWDLLCTYWSKWIDGPARLTVGAQPVSNDTEYFCPMDPGVVSDWPAKCGVCNMTLVRRTRGDVAPLPEGVVARMQLSPYRLYLGGVRCDSVVYRPLSREIELSGRVVAGSDNKIDFARVAVELTDAIRDALPRLRGARVYFEDRSSAEARVR